MQKRGLRSTARRSQQDATPVLRVARASKKQQQSEQTRGLLLRAAEKVFTRDGFEAAKLEDIAASAGYTRGAFYANFESKEDLFLAMLEAKIQERIAKLRHAAEQYEEPERKLTALRDHFVSAAKDRDWTILGLEFKLFALRHPELKSKLSAMRRRILKAGAGVLDEQLQRSHVKLPVSTTAFAISVSALTYSLELDRMLDKAISEEEIKKIGHMFFDCMVGRQVGSLSK